MTKLPAVLLSLVLLHLAASPASVAWCQALPAGSTPYQGFQIPDVQGSLQYAITASELATFGYSNSAAFSSTSISGDLGYLSKSDTHSFSVIYSGGYLYNTGGQPSSPFQNLALSQIFSTRVWHFTVSDVVNYLPYSPIAGLSGIAGVGDLSVSPVVQTSGTDQGILTGYAPRVSNSTALSVQRNLTGSTTVEGSGSYSVLRFVTDSSSGAINSDQVTGIGGATHRINARSSVSTNYTFSKFTYLGSTVSFISQGVNLEYFGQVNRKLSIDISAGPQRTSGATLPTASLNAAIALHMTYAGQFANASVGYTRSNNAGSGVITGGQSDNVEFNATRKSSRVWGESATARYTHYTSLQGISSSAFTSNVEVGSAQLSRQIGRNFSAFGSYTVEHQSVQSSGTALMPFSGVSQVLAAGLTYSPRPIQLSH